MDIRIDLKSDQRKLERLYQLAPGQIQKATKKVINQQVDKVTREAGGAIPRDAGTSVVGYRRVRSKKKRAKGRKRIRAQVWQGTLRVPAKYAGKPRQTKGGVRAGRHFFPGAFVATMSNGYTGVFKRVGNKPTPIEQEYVYLDNAQMIVRRLAGKMESDLRSLIEKEARTIINRVTR